MRHFTPPARAAMPPSLLGPLQPADYLALRIAASGLTLDAFARAIITVQDHGKPRPSVPVPTAESRLRFRQMRNDVALATKPGARLRDPAIVDLIASIIPFDPAVYRQLASEPADRHPYVCRGCGCSDHDACIVERDDVEHVCRKVTPGLCSHCLDRSAASAKVAA